ASLRGEAKLSAALTAFGIDVSGRVALDVGAAAGGFTRVRLEAGARRVDAVDAGHGQLLGSLRQDPRVVNLEATNVGDLTAGMIPDPIEGGSIDVSYLSLSAAARPPHPTPPPPHRRPPSAPWPSRCSSPAGPPPRSTPPAWPPRWRRPPQAWRRRAGPW